MEEKLKQKQGITLIALVITIIVLLILAGVSIAMLTGENGILTQAQNAKNKTAEAEVEEENRLETNNDYINEALGVKVGEKVTENNKTYTDKDGDTAKIPVGFAIVPGLNDISEGLVISDVENDIDNQGNQFVWIPVKSESDYVRNTTYANIQVSPLAYTDKDYLPDGIQPEIDSSITDEKQIGILNENAEKNAVLNSGGFYISRYEATIDGTTNNYDLETKIATDGSVKQKKKKGKGIWNYISQENAKIVAKSFINNNFVKSSLCSGIQWDLIMAFISSEERTDGMNQPFIVTEIDNSRHIGSSVAVSGNNEADKACNIYDLEGNAREYVAEKNTHRTDYVYILRGGHYTHIITEFLPAAYRGYHNNLENKDSTFRLTLYVM